MSQIYVGDLLGFAHAIASATETLRDIDYILLFRCKNGLLRTPQCWPRRKDENLGLNWYDAQGFFNITTANVWQTCYLEEASPLRHKIMNNVLTIYQKLLTEVMLQPTQFLTVENSLPKIAKFGDAVTQFGSFQQKQLYYKKTNLGLITLLSTQSQTQDDTVYGYNVIFPNHNSLSTVGKQAKECEAQECGVFCMMVLSNSLHHGCISSPEQIICIERAKVKIKTLFNSSHSDDATELAGFSLKCREN
ncbi:hypothetical protein GQX74_011266 [Glossina fuscipes]|nr:hypothetical protein GQX74_011266 [Glossina fuscipes]